MARYTLICYGNSGDPAGLLRPKGLKSMVYVEEAYGEVLRGIECVEFASGMPSHLMGSVLSNIASEMDSEMFRYPLGVVAGITPFNFPMMVPCWMFPLAITCRNTFVLKPSERTPLLANRLAELLHEAGLPEGVFNIVHGSHDVVNGILEHPEIKAVSFVGSQPVAQYIYTTAAQHGRSEKSPYCYA